MKRSPRLTQGFTRTLNPKLERFIRVNPTNVKSIKKKPSLGPQNGKWLKRASCILFMFSLFCEYIHLEYVRIHGIYRVDQAECGIHILVVAPQEYVQRETYHTHTTKYKVTDRHETRT